MNTVIAASAVVCATGIGAAQCSASFRAGLSGYAQSPVVGLTTKPLVMALVPEIHIEPLRPELEGEGYSDRERRMLQLAGTGLDQLRHKLQRALPLYLALPERSKPARSAARRENFLAALARQAGVELNLDASKLFEQGRAGGLLALCAAMLELQAGREAVLVGGVDSCLDLTWLAHMDSEQRLLGPGRRDGFVPGEAAAFLLLHRVRPGATASLTCIKAAGQAEDPGHRYSQEPALGVGLATAISNTMSQLPEADTINTCFAGLNGESFGAKAWGVAHIRHHERFASALHFEHPADSFGDVGAAMGPLLLALADETLRSGHRPGPMLVWAASDTAPVACAYLTADH
jgi:3-oxoacyl-[acyl-carrier-protein] synthase-1